MDDFTRSMFYFAIVLALVAIVFVLSGVVDAIRDLGAGQ